MKLPAGGANLYRHLHKSHEPLEIELQSASERIRFRANRMACVANAQSLGL